MLAYILGQSLHKTDKCAGQSCWEYGGSNIAEQQPCSMFHLFKLKGRAGRAGQAGQGRAGKGRAACLCDMPQDYGLSEWQGSDKHKAYEHASIQSQLQPVRITLGLYL